MRLLNAILILKIICWVYIILLKIIQVFVCWNQQGWVELLSKIFIIIWILVLKVWIVIRIYFIIWRIHLILIIVIKLTLLLLYLFIEILQFCLIGSLGEAHLLFFLIVLALKLVIGHILVWINPLNLGWLLLLHIKTLRPYSHWVFIIILSIKYHSNLIWIFAWLSFFFQH